MPKVSIIIPVYNVAPYLERCLLSVASQSYVDFEVVIVDDCGTDGSLQIAERFVNEYSGPVQFRIVNHLQNRGISAARNTGIRCASGDYLFFIDGDDVISSDCLEILVTAVCKNKNVQMAIGGMDVKFLSNEDGWIVTPLHTGLYKQELWALFVRWRYPVSACNKLIKKSFVLSNSLFFEEGMVHEDYLWSFCVACHLTCMYADSRITYLYLRREGSIDTSTEKKFYDKSYILANIKLAEYAIGLPRIRVKKSAFEYIEKLRIKVYKDALDSGEIGLAEQFYKEIRSTRYWGPLFLILRRCTKGSLLRSLHKFLPFDRGFVYYNKIIRKYGY